jgi:hypothetical protein
VVEYTSSSLSDHVPRIDESLGVPITCQRRSPGKRSDKDSLLITDNQRVASRGVERIGVSKDKRNQAEAAFRSYKPDAASFPDRIYRAERTKPLFILHLLVIGKEKEDLSNQVPVVGWSISFPQTAMEEDRVEYVVNTTWMREHYRDDSEDDELGGDND